jgi:Na+/melibiose symporter-like transporter
MLKLQRKYRRLKLLRWSCFILSIISATVPPFAAALKVAKIIPDKAGKWGLAGYAVAILSIAGLIVWRGLSKKYAAKLPWALGVCILAWGLAALLFSLRNIIDEAVYISFVFAIGASVAFVLSLLTDLFDALAAHVREDYKIQKLKE